MNPTPAGEERRGIAFGLAAYGLWGMFPLYFHLLASASPFEVVIHRVLWSLLVCLIAVAVTRGWHSLAPLRSPRLLGGLALAAFVLALNWGIYVYAVTSEQVVQASLGYYINPLITVLLGVVVLHERLRPAQWVAVGIGACAVLLLTLDAGRLPWIALTLAISFGVYGLIKKLIGVRLSALAGLTGETVVLAPVAALALIWLETTGRSTFTQSPGHAILLALSGVATVIPLLLFAGAARRVPLSTIGLMQYLTPTLQLLCGVLVFGETMSPVRWIGFGLVWTALMVLTIDTLRTAHHHSRETSPTLPLQDAALG